MQLAHCQITVLILLVVCPSTLGQEYANFSDPICLECDSTTEGRFWAFQGPGIFDFFSGIEGSKQPQDFGVNANLGLRGQVNFSTPIAPNYGVGLQLGTAVVGSGNAVQVFELLGESEERWQSFSTVGIFQRLPGGFSWGFAYDYLYQDSFDDFNLGQWRIRASQLVGDSMELGVTVNLSDRSDTGLFNSNLVQLEPIDQFHVFVRKYWPNQIYTTVWLGISDGHSEENAVTGSLPSKNDTILFGADLYVPLTNRVAIYGETNLIFPADTGAVDAMLGLEFSPFGRAITKTTHPFRALLPVAGSPTFTTNLIRR